MTVALTESPNRAEVMSSKDNVIELDGNIIKSSAIAAVRAINPFVNENADSAMAYAKTLQAPLKYVAIERVTKWEARQFEKNLKMPISSLRQRVDAFNANPADYPEYEKILHQGY